MKKKSRFEKQNFAKTNKSAGMQLPDQPIDRESWLRKMRKNRHLSGLMCPQPSAAALNNQSTSERT